jgi:hypothetical protein
MDGGSFNCESLNVGKRDSSPPRVDFPKLKAAAEGQQAGVFRSGRGIYPRSGRISLSSKRRQKLNRQGFSGREEGFIPALGEVP